MELGEWIGGQIIEISDNRGSDQINYTNMQVLWSFSLENIKSKL